MTHWHVTGRNGYYGDCRRCARFDCVFIYETWLIEMYDTTCETRPICMRDATYLYARRDLFVCETRPICMWHEGMDTVATADVTQDFFVNSRLSHYLLICEKRHVRIIYESHRMLHFGSWTLSLPLPLPLYVRIDMWDWLHDIRVTSHVTLWFVDTGRNGYCGDCRYDITPDFMWYSYLILFSIHIIPDFILYSYLRHDSFTLQTWHDHDMLDECEIY